MGKKVHTFRFKADEEMRDWVRTEAAADDLEIQVFIRRTMRDAMRRQMNDSSKFQMGEKGVKPGPMVAARERRRA